MKRRYRLLSAALALMLLAGCQCSHTYDEGVITREASCREEGVRTFTCQRCGETTQESIPMPEHSYRESVAREPTYEDPGIRAFTCEACGHRYTEPIPTLEKPVEVTVTGKRSEEGWLLDQVALDFRAENLGDKEIRGIKGTLVVMDQFEKEITRLPCSLLGQPLPAGGTADYPERSTFIDPTDEASGRLYLTDFEELRFAFRLEQVAYAREDHWQTTQGPLTLTITDKLDSPANYATGKVRSSTQLMLYVKNNTDHEMNGFEGLLTVKDLFGQVLTTYDCDFFAYHLYDREPYGRSFYLHFLINEFSEQDLRLFALDLEDLDFEFSLYSVEYVDETEEQFSLPGGGGVYL